MEDDKLKELFSDFKPELSSDFLFMSKLQRNMESVELIRQRSVAVRKRNKIAVAAAAISGFMIGVIMTLLLPIIAGGISDLKLNFPYIDVAPLYLDSQIFTWIASALVSGITAYNVYEITNSRLEVKNLKE